MKRTIAQLAALLFFAGTTYAQPEWTLRADSLPEDYFGVTVANGNLGIVSSREPMRPSAVILAGVYDTCPPDDVSNFLNGFNILDFTLEIDGERIDEEHITNHVQELNMREATLHGSFTVGGKASVEYTMLSLRHLPYSALMQLRITPMRKIRIASSVNLSRPKSFGAVRFDYDRIDHNINMLTASAKTPRERLEVAATVAFDFGQNEQPTVERHTDNADQEALTFEKELTADQPFSFSVIGSTITSASNPNPKNESKRLNIYACLEGVERLLDRHKSEWAQLWQSDIEIEGDLRAQRDVRSMLYHLYSFVRAGSGLSISPMGLSGMGYNGHIFWDADLWMFPPLLMLHPELAESMIEYRYARLEAARNNAYTHGYQGAMYPWESADVGVEETPVWALSGPFEHHITACVALAAWNYYCVTRDREWLQKKGFEIIRSCADFWISRVERNDDGSYSIRNVVAADEFAENVDDNAFTNASARKNLEVAAAAARLVGEKVDSRWAEIAAKLRILYFDNGVIREHATYDGRKVKQADVNLLAYPLEVVKDRAQILRDLEYYEPRFASGPAMTHSILSILYTRLGNPEKSYALFCRSYQPNQLAPFGVLSEYAAGNNPYFATGAGGTLQAVMMGFGGLSITEKGIVHKRMPLPTHWKRLTIKGVGPQKKTVEVCQ